MIKTISNYEVTEGWREIQIRNCCVEVVEQGKVNKGGSAHLSEWKGMYLSHYRSRGDVFLEGN